MDDFKIEYLRERLNRTTASQGSVAVEEPPVENTNRTDEEIAGESTSERTCEKCGESEEWGEASWCPACGYYPSIGKCVDLPTLKGEEKTINNWSEAIPVWAWILAAGCLGIVFFSVAIRLVLEESPWQGTWAVVQAMLGFISLIAAHVSAYSITVSKTDELGPAEMITKPSLVWKWVINLLPGSAKKLWWGAWSVTTIVTGLFIVGGINYLAITDLYAVKKKADVSLAIAVAKQRKVQGDESIDETLNELAETTEKTILGKNDQRIKKERARPNKAECVVIGYTLGVNDNLENLVLAGERDGVLQYIGNVPAADMSESQRREFQVRASQLVQPQSIISVPVSAVWLKPVMTCQVRYSTWSVKKLLEDALFDGMLAELK